MIGKKKAEMIVFFFDLNEKGERQKNLEKFLVFTFSQLMK